MTSGSTTISPSAIAGPSTSTYTTIDNSYDPNDGKLTDAYYFCLGGAVGQHAGFARPVGYRCLATDVPESIERLLSQYLASRIAEENLRQWFARHTNDELRAHLAGEVVTAVERDTPTGPVPHSVAD